MSLIKVHSDSYYLFFAICFDFFSFFIELEAGETMLFVLVSTLPEPLFFISVDVAATNP